MCLCSWDLKSSKSACEWTLACCARILFTAWFNHFIFLATSLINRQHRRAVHNSRVPSLILSSGYCFHGVLCSLPGVCGIPPVYFYLHEYRWICDAKLLLGVQMSVLVDKLHIHCDPHQHKTVTEDEWNEWHPYQSDTHFPLSQINCFLCQALPVCTSEKKALVFITFNIIQLKHV